MDNNIKTMINEESDNEELFYKISDYALEKEIKEGYDKLEENEKNLFMVGKILMEVNNGGFDQYFLNTEGIYARDTLHFLKLIGETKFSKLFSEAVNIFESDTTDDEKYDDFNELDDDFYEFDITAYKNLYDKCISYIRERVKQLQLIRNFLIWSNNCKFTIYK
ncbi:DUF4375 domain-containing protein [Clostridium sp. A1-XYC3]|uniref:DUF4375 domain-containing protein n=1 Tax=Clostridium tanneri TaxID=3037988 RepID=A0ABU4JVP9_9CLOT|nr:DUF4375 domain-containing protein [Clostridium sp. A1-XYC3]MDW8802182.1 DUF4375 domain-containing protein [Clostridium sp. A1-XYC3]